MHEPDEDKNSQAGRGATQTPKSSFRDIWNKISERWHKFSSIELDRKIELCLALAIAIFAGCQVYVAWNSAKGNTSQTNQLISAAEMSAYSANQNVQASRNFAESARSINQGISDAVDKLNLQAAFTEGLVQQATVQAKAATATAEAARRSADTAKDAMYLNERAWVGMNVSVAGPLSIRRRAGAYLQVKIELTNKGHSPAQYVKKWAMLVWDDIPSTEQIFKYCPITQANRADETDGVMLFPGDVDKGNTIPGTPPDAARAPPSEKPGIRRLTLVTCIDYTLAFDSVKHHETAQTFQVSWFNGHRWSSEFPYNVRDVIFSKVRIIPDFGSIAN